MCEKSCGCSQACVRRFRGCLCKKSGRRICWQDDRCDCFGLNRECDVDLCGSCGAATALDPVNRYNEEVLGKNCANISIQRNVPRRTLIGESEVAGFGLYMGEDVKGDDYIGEYKGEIITTTEASRRDIIYGHSKTMYTFTLNKSKHSKINVYFNG